MTFPGELRVGGGDSVRVGRNVGRHWAGERCQWPLNWNQYGGTLYRLFTEKGDNGGMMGWMSAVRCLLSTVMNSVLISVACSHARLMS